MTPVQTNQKAKKKIDCAYDELVDTDALIPNPRNPNKHPQKQLDLLAKIIKYQGFRNPIVVSERSGFIVKGHARLEAAKMLNIKQCPVDYQNYKDEAEEWADMLADNRLAELAETSLPELKDLLEELDTGAFEMDLTGYDMESLEMLMTQFHVDQGDGHSRDEFPDTEHDLGQVKDHNWFYITYYEEPERFSALKQILEATGVMKGQHEVDGTAFEELVNASKKCRVAGLNCADGKRCANIRDGKFRHYDGIRFTSDGFDCALPVSIDSHSVCAYSCLYCFADNLLQHTASHTKPVGRTSLKSLETIFSGREGKAASWYRKALKYHRRNEHGYPAPVQVGALCDPCDSIEQNSGWLLDFIALCQKHNQPARLSTKGAIWLLPEYQKAIAKKPELFWIAFSIITNDDALSAQIDRGAPVTSIRLQAMQAVKDAGANVSLRLRPIILNVTDHNKGHEELIKRAADCGARAVSYETMFFPGSIPKAMQYRWALLGLHTGINFKQMYSNFGSHQSCMRPPYTWTEDIMHRVKELAHNYGMVAGVSDPVWKQLSDYGCCCGIPPDDVVFGNWERENATNAIVNARNGKNGAISLADIVPTWAYDVPLHELVNGGVGPLKVHENRHRTWADELKRLWNNPSSQRGPMNYFQGALQIAGEDKAGNLTYQYVGLQRQYKPSPWNV